MRSSMFSLRSLFSSSSSDLVNPFGSSARALAALRERVGSAGSDPGRLRSRWPGDAPSVEEDA